MYCSKTRPFQTTCVFILPVRVSFILLLLCIGALLFFPLVQHGGIGGNRGDNQSSSYLGPRQFCHLTDGNIYGSNIGFGESYSGYYAFLLYIYCSFFTVTQQSISFCQKMKTRAIFQAEGKAVIANLLDVSGSVGCVPCCLSLLTHHLSSCLLEAFQSLFLSRRQTFLQLYMSLDKTIHTHHTHRKMKVFIAWN